MHDIEAVGGGVAVADAEVAAAGAVEENERPWVFGLLPAPIAVLSNGIIQGVLSFLMRRQGVSVGRIAGIVSLLILPQTIYFLWSPITDFFIRRRTWLMLGAGGAGLLMALAFHEKSLASPTAIVVMFLSACCGQLVVSSCGGMMGTLRRERSRRVASGFYQGSSLGFGGLAVFVLAMLVTKMSQGWLGWVAAALIAAPSLAALAAPKQEAIVDDGLGKTMGRVWGEFKSTFLCWRAVPYTLMMVFPQASGSAIGLLPGVAQDYGVNSSQMAWMNGLAGALLMAAGSLAATFIPARMRASVGYMAVALVNAGTLGVLWLGPLTPATYYVGVTLYLFTIGAAYAMFTAVVLEFLGHSGKSGSGRYSIINSLGNVPVAYMVAMDGWGDKTWGTRGLAGTEAVLGGVGAALLLAYFLTKGREISVDPVVDSA
jgi:MFS transporter, PAT family, beta-lactamase induction signal transducer AmpG